MDGATLAPRRAHLCHSVPGDGCYKRAGCGQESAARPYIDGDEAMALKAPGILTFMLAVILTVCVLVVRFFGAEIPFINGYEFWVLLGAQLILITGCMIRGL